MADVTGTIGNEHVELDNAATEATLRALLAATKGLNQSIIKMQPKTGGKGGIEELDKASEKTEKSFASLVKSVNPTGVAFDTLTKAASGLGGVLGSLMAGAVKTGENLIELGKAAVEGNARMSGVYKAFEDLPFGIGKVASLFTMLAKIQEANLDAYRQMSKSGVNFSGSLTDLRLAASDAYMTLDQFTDFVGKNSEALAMMGETADKGAKNFVRLSHSLIDSKLGDQLMAMGMTTEEINQGMANYIKMSGGRTDKEMQDTAKLSKAAGEYMMQLDALSQITGESRAAEEEKLKQATQDAQFEAMMQGLDEEGRKKAMAAMANALATGGKGAADALKAKMLGIPPVTEAAQNFVALYPKAASHIERMGDAVTDQKKGIDDVNHINGEAAVALAKENKALGKETRAAITAAGGSLASTITDATKTQNMLNAKGIKTADDYDKMMTDIAKNEEDRRKSEAEAAAAAEKSLKDLGNTILSALTPVFKAMAPLVTDIVRNFASWLKSVDMDKLGKDMAGLAKAVTEYMSNLFSPEGRQKIINDITYYMKLMLIEIKKAIIPWYSEADAEKDKKKLDEQKSAYDAQAEQVRLATGAEQRKTALALDGDKAAQERVKAENKASQERIKNANEQLRDGKITKEQAEAIRKREQADIDKKQAALDMLDAKTGKLDDAKRKELQAQQKTLEEGGAAAKEKMDKVREQEIKDKSKEGTLTGKATGAVAGGVTGGVAGSVGGATAGAWVGGAIGTLLGPLGTVAGAAIGSSVGSWLGGAGGALLGGYIGEEVGNAVTAPSEKAVKKSMDEKKALEKRAAGGPVKKGEPYWVGESGPEIMKPDTGGQIIPNSMLQMPGTKDINSSFDAMTKELKSQSMGLPPMSKDALNFSSLMPDGLSTAMKTVGAKTSQLTEDTKEKDKKIPTFEEMVAKFGKSVQEKVLGTNNATTPHMTAEQGKNLVTELQLLNKQTADMLKYIRDTADHAKNTVDATKALNGNIFAR
jgi:hypothetical protein